MILLKAISNILNLLAKVHVSLSTVGLKLTANVTWVRL